MEAQLKTVILMIDTILLKVPHPNFAITRHEMFEPNARGIFHTPYLPFNGQRFIKCINNPTSTDKLAGKYLPRLTLYKSVKKGGFNISLHIEFSVPKLLYGNNFDEVEEADFEAIIQTLCSQLLYMGVHVSKENLRTAPVYNIHYSKNILFTDHITASVILNSLEKINVNSRLDLNKTDYRNQGEAVRFYAKSHEFVTYDKIADLTKSKDRAIEKEGRDFNLQPSLFDDLRHEGSPIEVVRLELRLKTRVKIRQSMKKAGVETDLTFQSLFKKKIAQKLLTDYWNVIYEELKYVILQDLTTTEQFELISAQNRGYTPARTLAMTALCAMIREEGYRKVKSRFTKQKYSSQTFGRYFKDIKNLDMTILNRKAPYDHILQTLNSFKSLKKADFSVYLPHTP